MPISVCIVFVAILQFACYNERSIPNSYIIGGKVYEHR